MLPVIEEFKTLEALKNGASIARFGDGELRLALGGSVGHQAHDPVMCQELNWILQKETKCLVGIPYIDESSPKKETWEKYGVEKFRNLYNPNKQYYSAFITRPDSAPWIDTAPYWNEVKSLWAGKDITIVCGSSKGFRVEEMDEARSIKYVPTLPEQAYSEIHKIEKEIGPDKSRLVLLAVGATATVLAWRLSENGHQALDLGHISMFMRRRFLFNNQKGE